MKWGRSTMHACGVVVFVLANIVCGCVLAWLTRGRTAFRLTAFGAGVFVLTLISWFAFVAPVNAQLAQWLNGPVPADWASWRAQWEGAHAVNAVLQLFGFAALVWSVVRETSGEREIAALESGRPAQVWPS